MDATGTCSCLYVLCTPVIPHYDDMDTLSGTCESWGHPGWSLLNGVVYLAYQDPLSLQREV